MTTRRRRPLVAQRSAPRAEEPKVAPGQTGKLGAELKSLRARLGGYGDDLPTTPGDWHSAAWDYDQALVLAAETLGVPHPELDMVLGRRRLTITERNIIEKGLVTRGIDLGPPPSALPPSRG
jgi:hypothetical protein